jgi:hypothetical protein
MKLSEEVRAELDNLSDRQRDIVLDGLNKKLGFFKKSGILSYRYETCPICNDIGSTIENPKCEECYLKVGCKEPFNRGFRNDPQIGFEYFNEMRRHLLEKG